jgi:hypothetical protein
LQLQPRLCLADAGVSIVSSYKTQHLHQHLINLINKYIAKDAQTIADATRLQGLRTCNDITKQPTPILGDALAACTIFGAKASGLRDSICCLVLRTVSSNSGLLKHSWHAQELTQYMPAAKHSQYLSDGIKSTARSVLCQMNPEQDLSCFHNCTCLSELRLFPLVRLYGCT